MAGTSPTMTKTASEPALIHGRSSAISPPLRASFAVEFPPSDIKGAGNAGRPSRPQPRMQNKNKHTSIVTTVTPETPGIPRAMVLRLIARSPR